MNYRLLSRFLGIVVLLLGGSMLLSLPWAWPVLGNSMAFERTAFLGMVGAISITLAVGAVLLYVGRKATGRIYRKEAMATVGLSWVLAAVLGALPFLLSKVHRDAETRMTVSDAIFESASGFSGTGATVISELDEATSSPRNSGW